MNKRIVLLLAILFTGIYCAAQEMQPGPQKAKLASPQGQRLNSTREVPPYQFSVAPVTLMQSYYDYMIGNYNGLPLRVIPQSAGGGYFMTYHGARTSSTASTARRAFYSYISPTGVVLANNEITYFTNREGYTSLAVDPVSGKPLYSWHANADTDVQNEIQFTSDAFLEGIAGVFNDVVVCVDNPITITAPNGVITTGNEFIWPTNVIGPSPIAGKRRIYVLGRNSAQAPVGAPSENPYIAYADFDANIIENGFPNFVWSYISIPEMDNWNADAVNWRRPNNALCADNAGNIYYVGYHSAYVGTNGAAIAEADIDVFKCGNYGAGTWQRYTANSTLPSVNPNGYFKDADNGNIPYTDAQMRWTISNSGHLNAVVDNEGKIHVAALWALGNTGGSYWPEYQVVKEFTFDPQTNNFQIKEIYPQTGDLAGVYQPWDIVAPWGDVDAVDAEGNPVFHSDWPFCHWDNGLHDGVMEFHYNNIKMSEANEHGQMVCVWQDSWRARQANVYGDWDYVDYANVPEIFVAISANNGYTWSEPIVLNNVDTPIFANIKPMWVYPADKVIYAGVQDGHEIGKIGLMFYDDATWGSNVLTPPAHPTNDGGRVMFAELQISFPGYDPPPPEDPFGTPTVLSSSMSIMAGVQIDGQAASAGDVVAAYVQVNGVHQLRGKATIAVNSGVAGCLLQVYTETNNETVVFQVWDASTYNSLGILETVPSQVNGVVGSWPDNPFWLHASTATDQYLTLYGGWNMVSTNLHPSNMSITNVFDNTMLQIQMIKSPEGVFVPGNPFNTLTSVTDGKGYFVKLMGPMTSELVHGLVIDPSTPIPLDSGWNLVGYTRQSWAALPEAVFSISQQLMQIKSSTGVYIPGNPYSTLGYLEPKCAYWMQMNAAADLVYIVPVGKGEAPESPLTSEVWGSPIVKTNSQTLLVGLDASLNAGDLIGAFVNNELRGLSAVKLVDGRRGALLQVFTDEAGETIEFRAFANNGHLSTLQPPLQSVPGSTIGNYQAGEFYSLTDGSAIVPALTTRLLSASPNPFKSHTSIVMNIGKDAEQVSLEIFNIRGQKVRTVYNGTMNYGTQTLTWDGIDDRGSSIASGLYFCRFIAGKNIQTLKMMVLK